MALLGSTNSAMALLGSTNSAMALLESTCMTLFHFTILYNMSLLLCLTLLHSTMALLGSTLPHSALIGSTWLSLTLLLSTMAVHLAWLYLALRDSTTLYNRSTWFYGLTLPHSTMAVLGEGRT